MINEYPSARSIPEYIGDVIAGVWPEATRLEANRRNFAALLEEADADDAKTAFIVQFVGFIEKPMFDDDTGQRIQRATSDPQDLQQFAIVVRFAGVDDAADLRADGYTRMYDAVRALRAGCRFTVDGAVYDLDVVGGQPLDDEEITVDVFEITVTAQ